VPLPSRALGAGYGLVLVLALSARPPAVPRNAPCRHPAERAGNPLGSTWVACDPEEASKPLRGAASLLFGRPLDLARAPAEVLEVLPGIGPVRAGEIVAARSERPFRDHWELTRVRGLGPRRVAALEGWVEVGAPRPESAQGGPPAGLEESQKPFQLLSIPCENSYKRRADPAGSAASWCEEGAGGRADAKTRSAGGSASLECGLQGLQGGSPSCD
jgi:hypothetical protein